VRPRVTSAPLRAPDDGIVTTGRGVGWMADRWNQLIDQLQSSHGPRLTKGKNLARTGRVRGLWFSPGLASAQVVAEEVFNVSIRFRVFSDPEWKRILDVLLDNLLHIASLLEGQLPQPLVQQLEDRGVALLPTWTEIEGDCNCDDYMLPCSHMAAVHNVLAEALDGEPFLLFTLRGRPRTQLLAQMRRAWGDTDTRTPASVDEECEVPEAWLASPQPLPAPDFRFKETEHLGAGLRALGPPPGDADLLRALGPLYQAGAKAALDVALEDGTPAADGEQVRAFRRSVQRPTQAVPVDAPVGPSSRPDLTEALVDALAECECAKSQELAARVGAPVLEVRQELLELERLGIVYRTGQTRGTRWWLG
jgi:uncharacterized Zn finger protein